MGVLGIYYIQVNICQFYQIIYLISFYLFFINICLYLNEFAERTIYIYIYGPYSQQQHPSLPLPRKKNQNLHFYYLVLRKRNSIFLSSKLFFFT